MIQKNLFGRSGGGKASKRARRRRRKNRPQRRQFTIETLEDRIVLTGVAATPDLEPSHAVSPLHAIFSEDATEADVVSFHNSVAAANGGDDPFMPFQFNDLNRWTSTATDGPGLTQGDPTTITWSFVPDGLTIPNFGDPGAAAPSNLIAFLDGLFGMGPGGEDLELRPWFSLFEDSFDRMGELSGIEYVYEDGVTDGTAGDNLAVAFSSANPGAVGSVGDVRIGGRTIDGEAGPNILAFNFFPNFGEMVIDTSNFTFYGAGGVGFRNVVMHEHGHGLGFAHECPTDGTTLMEPFINTGFDGPQFDDILALHRGYGDFNEFAGNETTGTATPLGLVATGTTVSVGSDPGPGESVLPTETDFVSIDDDSDIDVYSFTVVAGTQITLTLTPQGATYLSGVQNPDGTCSPGTPFDASAQSDLTLELLNSSGVVLATANLTSQGGVETISLPAGAGTTFFARVTGAANTVQLYELEVSTALPAAVLDFGDAPDGPYATLSTSLGPSHVVTAGIQMGASIDAETEALASAAADGDDVTGAVDDEDGVDSPSTDLFLFEGVAPSVDLTVTNVTGFAATLDGWIDYNGNGVFEASEKNVAGGAVPDGTAGGPVTLTFPVVPLGTAGTTTFARFRLTTDAGAFGSPTGAATDGEVEDYQVTISPPLTQFVWAVHPAGLVGEQILKIDPVSGAIIDMFAAPDILSPGDTEVGLSIAEGGSSLIYANSATSQTTVFRLDPNTGAIMSVEDRANFPLDGLSFQEAGGQNFLYNSNPTVELRRQTGFSGPETGSWATGLPVGGVGGDGTGREFAFFADGMLHEYDPFVDTNSFISSLPAPAADIEGVAFDGSNLYVSTATGALYTLDPDTGAVLNVVNPVGVGEALVGLGALAIPDLLTATDFGDAPDTYGTLLGSNGARHSATGPTLGTARDAETEGNPSVDATGDDTTGTTPDDEDGVTVGVTPLESFVFTSAVATTISVDVQNITGGSHTVQVWVDLDADGVFDNPSELIHTETGIAGNGTFTFTFTPPAGLTGTTFARFRLSSTGGLDPLGAAIDGEVEDYEITIVNPDFHTPILNFDGADQASQPTNINPPDPVGDVGPNHYVQMVNYFDPAGPTGSEVRIFDKLGNEIDQFVLSTLGGATPIEGRGDPIVLYDHLADRWLLSEFAATGNTLIVYISKGPTPTSDPNDWFRYTFNTPRFPDYPKYSVWGDAYYVTTNESNFFGAPRPAVYALDRATMLAGGTPRPFQRFLAPPLAGFGFQALTPADLDGMEAPPGSPAYFMRHVDDEAHSPGTNDPENDFLQVWQFSVDFDTPANSVFSLRDTITVPEFDSNLNGLFSFSAFPQPNGPNLDPLREVIMWRLQYRNFGTHESLVGNYVTDINDTDTGGIRWFELRKTPASSAWTVFQQGEVSIGTDISRWMGAIAMDGAGNIALGYSVSSESEFPGIRYIGRKATDPLGVMTTWEVELQEGLGSNNSVRWGDYAAMSIDPVDDSTFWFTGEYGTNSWATKIGAMAFASTESGVAIDESVTSPIDEVVVNEASTPLTDTYEISLTTTPTGPVEVTASVADGQTLVSTDGVVFASSVVVTLSDTTAATITVRAVPDLIREGRHFSVIEHMITSSTDPAYPEDTNLLNVTVRVNDEIIESDLVGVDFDDRSGVSPTNWNDFHGIIESPGTLTNLTNEGGAPTLYDFSMTTTGPNILSESMRFNTSDQIAQLPSHLQPLPFLDGINFTISNGPGTTHTLTFSDLDTGTYEVYVFGRDDSPGTNSITFNGGTTITQSYAADELAVNDELGTSARTLASYAEFVTTVADPANPGRGMIVIDVTNVSGFLGLAGVAINPVMMATLPLTSDAGARPGADPVDAADVSELVAVAKALWGATDLTSAQRDTLKLLNFLLDDLPQGLLGQSSPELGTVTLDVNGDGYGWYVDKTPGDNAEFSSYTGGTSYAAGAGSAAQGSMDLLTTVMHEIGHHLGLQTTETNVLMSEQLTLGTRRLIQNPPVGIPSITGTAMEDQVLTAETSGISDHDGTGAFSYQWLRNGVTIDGATSDSYTLGDADVGSRISVQVSYTDGQGTEEGPLTSSETGLVDGVADHFIVNSIGDGGDTNPGDGIAQDAAGNTTLRAAIEEANALANADGTPDVITFNIAGAGLHTISPLSALPEITEAVIIDGTTQDGFAGTPLIELDGSQAGLGVDGLTIVASGAGSTIQGLAVNRFDLDGILLSQGGGNTIVGNFVGVDPTGNAELGNGRIGINIFNSSGNQIGGTTAGTANLISGNRHGVVMGGAASIGNVLEGNIIGANLVGDAALANSLHGIVINNGANSNTIGGTADGAGNLISGNGQYGAVIDGVGDNVLQGNQIGTNAAGTSAVGNGMSGVLIRASAGNLVGGVTSGAGNVISGNRSHGITISGLASSNVVQGNLIGTDAAGTAGLANSDFGVLITQSTDNQIGGTSASAANVISGNRIGVVIGGSDSTANKVEGNLIGTTASGNGALGNDVHGLVINSGANGNTIGGTAAGAGNVISGNLRRGVMITGATTTGNMLEGNLIGTDQTGSAALANGLDGVALTAGANSNTIGGTAAGAGNVISGNSFNGVFIFSATATGNLVQGNLIGTNAAGDTAVGNGLDGVVITGNANSNFVGGTAAGAGNVISGNGRNGVVIFSAGSTGNVVQGNFIGSDAAGSGDLGNAAHGLIIDGGASSNTIGGTTDGAGNVIAHNDSRGVLIVSGTGNAIQQNSIFNNGLLGIDLLPDSGATVNDAGDADSGANNLQNFPDIQSAILTGDALQVTYSVSSLPANSAYDLTVEFFLADGSNEEGEVFLGSATYSDAGNSETDSITISSGVTVNVGDRIVATATDSQRNTSEFSASATVTGAAPLLAQQSATSSASSAGLTTADIDPILDQAIAAWAAVGISDTQLKTLQGITVQITDLPGLRLAEALGSTITLDVDAAGHGWFIDTTPERNEEFALRTSQGLLAASGPAAGRMDLLSVLFHELGHTIGLNDDYSDPHSDDISNGWLPTGTRRLPTAEDLDNLFASDEALDEALA